MESLLWFMFSINISKCRPEPAMVLLAALCFVLRLVWSSLHSYFSHLEWQKLDFSTACALLVSTVINLFLANNCLSITFNSFSHFNYFNSLACLSTSCRTLSAATINVNKDCNMWHVGTGVLQRINITPICNPAVYLPS